MKPVYRQILKFFGFLLLTVLLFWLVYRDQDPANLMTILQNDVDYTWVWIAIILGLLSHVSRALRWRLVASSMGYDISFANSFMGVMIGYFANMVIPRMGEFTRCGVVSKYEHIPFSKLLGTVVTERVIDMLMLLFLTLVVIVTQFGQVEMFLEENETIRGEACLEKSLQHEGIDHIVHVMITIISVILRKRLANSIELEQPADIHA